MKEWFKTQGDPDPARSGTLGQAGDPEADRRRIARKRARAKLGFYQHLGLWLVVNAILVGVNLVFSPGTLWFYWSVAGWGLALAAHGATVFLFGPDSVLLRKLEERELRNMAERE